MERLPGVMMGGLKKVSRKRSVLERLNASEAQTVLHRLLAAHPDLCVEAENIARSQLGEVTFEIVADDLVDALSLLGLDDLNARAGRHSWGYVEPTEAAWEILEEAMEPFLADIKRRTELGLEADALEICKGIVLGLYHVEHGQGGDLVGWAPDFPAESACKAIETWRVGVRTAKTAEGPSRRKRPSLPREFIDGFVPEWREMIGRMSSRKR